MRLSDRSNSGPAIVAMAVLVSAVVVMPLDAVGVSGCDTFRTDVRTLSDPDRRSVDLVPGRIAVEDLLAEPRPEGITATSTRLEGIERRSFRLRVRLVAAAVRPSGEIDLTVSPRWDLRRTLQVAFSPADCIPLGYRRPGQVDARESLLEACGGLPVDRRVRLRGLATIEGVGFWGPAFDGSNGVAIGPALSFAGDCWGAGSKFIVVGVGDSVPLRLIEPIGSATGWRTGNGSVGGCPVSGEEPVNLKGEGWTTEGDCREMVPPVQSGALAIHPDIVLWWDRPSISHARTFDDQLVLASTEAFWAYRQVRLRASARALTADGATVVFIATEPLGLMAEIPGGRPWKQFFTNHYFDYVTRWNAMMEEYARTHPRRALYISVTEDVCHEVTSPCDDSVNGVPARFDGVHYEGPGVDLVVDSLLSQLSDVVERLKV